MHKHNIKWQANLDLTYSAPEKAEPSLGRSPPGPSGPDIKAAGVLLWVDENQVIVGMKPDKGFMDFGGKLKPGETPRICAARELQEETGLDPSNLAIDWSLSTYIPDCKYISFQGRLGNLQPKPSKEMKEYKTLSVYDLPADCSYRLQRVLALVKQHPSGTALPIEKLSDPTSTSLPNKSRRERIKRVEDGRKVEAQGNIAPVGANGRPIVVANVKYSVDVAALRDYAETDEAGRTKACDREDEARSNYTERELIHRFLQHVVPTASGDGLCTVSYTRCEVGQALVDAGFLEQARLYPDKWPSCVTQLGKKLRAIALGKFYVEMDDKDAFHKLLQARTRNNEARELIERIITDSDLKPMLSQHYFDAGDRVDDIKTLLHSISNGGTSAQWQSDCGLRRTDHKLVVQLQQVMGDVTHEIANVGAGPQAIKLISEQFPTKRKRIVDPSDPTKKKEITVPRDPARCWKSYVLQNDEVHGLLAKMKVAANRSVPTGPPLHDCLFVEKSCDNEALAIAMSEAIENAVGVNVEVRAKRIEDPNKTESAFSFQYGTSRFQEKEFASNTHLTTKEEIDQSLGFYNNWLRRFFVSVTDEVNPMVAQVYYFPNTDRVKKVVCRTPQGTKQNFLDMDIITEPPRSLTRAPNTIPLLSWYLQKNRGKRSAEHVEMWTSPEDIAAHPNDLNIFGGLEFDERFYSDSTRPDSVQFSDPFPNADQSCVPSVLASDAEWKKLEGLPFILWHLKYILCGGNDNAFTYAMQWFGYIFQKRRKPGVMLQFLGEEGIGKSAIFGHNQTGPGIVKRIYGQYFQWSDDIETLLGKFNGLSMDRLFCVMEEAGTYRKGHRDHNKMKSMITEGTMVVEIKNVNAVNKNDNRAFAMLTNSRDSLKVTDGARRFLCVEGNDELSQKAVDEGRCNMTSRREYMAKLDLTKNDDDVAYEFFKYCMTLDLSNFHIDEPPRTELFEEQRQHNECALKRFLLDVRSGEYEIGSFPGERHFTALELFRELKLYVAETGAASTIESAMALGRSLSKNYAALAPKVDGRVAKYKLRIGDLHAVSWPGEDSALEQVPDNKPTDVIGKPLSPQACN